MIAPCGSEIRRAAHVNHAAFSGRQDSRGGSSSTTSTANGRTSANASRSRGGAAEAATNRMRSSGEGRLAKKLPIGRHWHPRSPQSPIGSAASGASSRAVVGFDQSTLSKCELVRGRHSLRRSTPCARRGRARDAAHGPRSRASEALCPATMTGDGIAKFPLSGAVDHPVRTGRLKNVHRRLMRIARVGTAVRAGVHYRAASSAATRSIGVAVDPALRHCWLQRKSQPCHDRLRTDSGAE